MAIRKFGKPEIKAASDSLLQNITHNVGRIAVTWMGVLGDSGYTTPGYLFHLHESQRAFWVRSKESYQGAIRSRQILSTAGTYAVVDSRYQPTAAAACDNRFLVPPFMPVLRGQDLVFGYALQMCDRRAYVGYVPFSIEHRPVDARGHSLDDIDAAPEANPFHVLMRSCMELVEIPEAEDSTQKRLLELGDGLIELGECSAAEFRQIVSEHRARQYDFVVAEYERALDRYGRHPTYWASDLERLISAVEAAAAAAPQQPVTDVLDGVPNVGESYATAQRLVLRYGKLLRAWPSIIEGVRLAKTNGLSFGTRI
jgi:hypothetical protein